MTENELAWIIFGIYVFVVVAITLLYVAAAIDEEEHGDE